jgi:hypothetical protein
LVFIHELKSSLVSFDSDPAVYLHWAALLPLRAREFVRAKRQQMDAVRLKRIERVLRLDAGFKSKLRKPYQAARHGYRDAFIRWASEARLFVDVVVCCPSSRDEAAFYLGPVLDAVRLLNARALDLSGHFTKERGYKVGAGASWEEAAAKITFRFVQGLNSARRVLLIDDVWTQGWTVGVLLSHLLGAGLPPDVSVSVLAPLRVVPGGADELLSASGPQQAHSDTSG